MTSPPYFEVLGVAPLLGHGFGASEEPPSRGAVAVLGPQESWERLQSF